MEKQYDYKACMKVLLGYVQDPKQCATIMEKLEPIMLNQDGCDCCHGDLALVYNDNENCAFVDRQGEIMVVVNDKTMRFKVSRCPNCGKVFRRQVTEE